MSLRHLIAVLALVSTTAAVLDACGYNGTSSNAGASLSGNYAITAFSKNALTGGTVNGTLALTSSTYKFNIVASILSNVAFADSGAYTLYGSTITMVSQRTPPLANCVGPYSFRDHTGAGSDTLTINCTAAGDQLISQWVK